MQIVTFRTGRLLAVAIGVTALAVGACGGSDEERAETASSGGKTAAAVAPEVERTDTRRTDTEDAGKTDAGDARPKSEPPRRERPATPEQDDAPNAGGDEAAVAAVVDGVYDDLAAGDATGVCRAMSRRVREQIATQVYGGSTEPPRSRTCAASFAKFLGVAARSGIAERTLEARATAVEIDGSTATATVSLPGGSGKVTLVEEDGKWRFDAPPGAP